MWAIMGVGFVSDLTLVRHTQPIPVSDRSHPNVVKLYGYCLEPPTVCLILELLPLSLKELLYPPHNAAPATSAQGSMAASGKLFMKTSSGISSRLPVALASPSSSASGATQTGQSSVSVQLSKHTSVTTGDMTRHHLLQGSPKSSIATRTSLPLVSGEQQTFVTAVSEGQTWQALAAAKGSVSPGADATTVHSNAAFQTAHTSIDAYPHAHAQITISSIGNHEGLFASRISAGGSQLTEPASAVDAGVLTGAAPQSPTLAPQSPTPRLTMERMLQIASDVAAGLVYLHSRPLLTSMAAADGPPPTVPEEPESEDGASDAENSSIKDGGASNSAAANRSQHQKDASTVELERSPNAASPDGVAAKATPRIVHRGEPYEVFPVHCSSVSEWWGDCKRASAVP
jgi:hypothetical protein